MHLANNRSSRVLQVCACVPIAVVLVLSAAAPAWSQDSYRAGDYGAQPSNVRLASASEANTELAVEDESGHEEASRSFGGRVCSEPGCQGCDACGCGPAWSAGAEFLLVRPHFSEAIAFAQGTQTASSFGTVGRELHWGYDASIRTFLTRHLDDNDDLQFAYWHFRGATSADGAVSNAGEFIVDPFGNLVGAVAVIDPADRRFGQVLVGGDAIRTSASVETNVFDLDFRRRTWLRNSSTSFDWSVGARIADVDQFYGSTITSRQAGVVSDGIFTADFIGAGPRIGLGSRWQRGRLSLFANFHASLLVGQYDVRSSQVLGGVFRTSQEERLTRTVPVFETDFGAACQVRRHFDLAAGWTFQSWIDLGASGGRFGGLFVGADDANNMSFDALFLRGTYSF